VAYAGRSIDGSEPRYLFPPNFRKSQVVFNLHRAAGETARWAIVVEGFFDCLRVHQAGYRNVVALMGASLSEVQEQLLLERFQQLVVMLDGDEAGRRASQQLAARLSGRVSLTRVVVPSGGQPDQLSNEEIEWILCGASGAPGVGDEIAVSIRLTRVPAGPCCNRPVRGRLAFRCTQTDCFKAGGLPKLNLP
jgi:hypothetical protein